MKEYKEEDYLMLSGLQHFAFCRRQWALIHVEQQWADNYLTTDGHIFHKRAHDETSLEKRGDILIARGLRIASKLLGVTGQCDVVEFHRSEKGVQLSKYDGLWNVYPIEYKRGMSKDDDSDILQLCAQAMCLEEMFVTDINEGALYYGENKRRQVVCFTNEIREKVTILLEEMHDLYNGGYTPKVKTDKKCRGCSLRDLCLPKLQININVSSYIKNHLEEM